MAAQQVSDAGRLHAATQAARDRAMSNAAYAWRSLDEEQKAHAETRASAAAAATAAAAALAAAEATYRAKLHASYMRELDNDIAHDAKLDQLRRGHVKELAEAVAAARSSERKRLQEAVGPGLQTLEENGRALRRRLEAVQGEASDDRLFVWDRLAAMPPDVREWFLS
jgi:hypothetical protein